MFIPSDAPIGTAGVGPKGAGRPGAPAAVSLPVVEAPAIVLSETVVGAPIPTGEEAEGFPATPTPDAADPGAATGLLPLAIELFPSESSARLGVTALNTGIVALGSGVGTSGVKVQNFVRADLSGGGNVHVYDYQAATALRIPSAVAYTATGSAFVQTTSGSGAVTLTSPYGDGPADVSVNAWWDTAYRTRRCFTITNPSAQPTLNQPASLVFDASADLSAGRLAAGASDLRATTGGNSPTALSFYAAGPWAAATSSSIVNVRIPSLAPAASIVVCVYYGNPSAGASPSAVQFARKFPLYRINNGGAATNDTLEATDANRRWQADTANGVASSGTGPAGTWSLASAYSYGPVAVTPLSAGANAVPSDVPASILPDENYAPWNLPGGCSGTWDHTFTMPANKPVEIRWYSAELYQSTGGARRFHVDVNGTRQLTNFDPFTATGSTAASRKAGMWSWTVGPGGAITGASPLLVRSTCTGADTPGLVAIELLDNTTLGVSGGSSSESTLATSGTWTTPPLDAGTVGTGMWGTADATTTIPIGAGLSFQIRWAATSAGLTAAAWQGPDGTAATSYAVGSPVPIPYAADGTRFAQLQFQLTGTGLVGPTVATVTAGSQLPELTRSAEGTFVSAVTVTAGTPSARWLVRIRAGDASLSGKATSVVAPAILSGGANLAAAQLRLESRTGAAWCCGPTQVQIVAGAITAPPPAPTPTSPGGDGFRSVRLDVIATATATASVLTVVVKVALSATVALEIPLAVKVQT